MHCIRFDQYSIAIYRILVIPQQSTVWCAHIWTHEMNQNRSVWFWKRQTKTASKRSKCAENDREWTENAETSKAIADFTLHQNRNWNLINTIDFCWMNKMYRQTHRDSRDKRRKKKNTKRELKQKLTKISAEANKQSVNLSFFHSYAKRHRRSFFRVRFIRLFVLCNRSRAWTSFRALFCHPKYYEYEMNEVYLM